jgi:hypothetical protein
MYMDITILGYRFNLEILILIGVVYLILVVHLFCGCCNVPRLIEGLGNMASTTLTQMKELNHQLNGDYLSDNMESSPIQPVVTKEKIKEAITSKKAETVSTTKNKKSKEGFTGANINYGDSSPYDLSNEEKIDISKWESPNMTVKTGQPLSAGVKKIMDRKPQQIPLPEGEMVMFANTEFKPDCCPSSISNSQGCACMSVNQYNYLKNRGGNNVPYSEY